MRISLMAIFFYCSATTLFAMEGNTGQAVFQNKCASCHKLPVTGSRSAQQWELIVAVMQQTMANKGVAQLSEQEQRELLQYLVSTAPAIDPTKEIISAQDTFVARCALCHQLPEPTMLRPIQWQAILVTMQTRMQQAGIPVLTQQETTLVLEYLSQQTRQ